MKSIPKTEGEILKAIRVGDVVQVLLHPAGPGTEEDRRLRGHECDLKITRINEKCRDFDGEYFIKDLEALLDWITMMDGVNDGAQIGERKTVPDIPVYCIEDFVERAPLTIDDAIEDAASAFAEAVARRRFSRRPSGSPEAWMEFENTLQAAACELAENALKEAR